KTAAYTVERPLHIGAALAGAPADTVSALREFGVAVGQAFQLRDDLLGVYGDPDVTGKPSGDVLREGKRTLLLARGVRSAPPEDAEYLLSVLGTDVDDDALDRARRILTDSGAVASVESEIDALTDRALAAIDSGSVSAHGRETLRALAGAGRRRGDPLVAPAVLRPVGAGAVARHPRRGAADRRRLRGRLAPRRRRPGGGRRPARVHVRPRSGTRARPVLDGDRSPGHLVARA